MSSAKRKPEPEQTPRRRASGPSGPTQSKDARRESGRVRVEVWLSAEAVERLDAMRGERTRRDAIEAIITLVDAADPCLRTSSPVVARRRGRSRASAPRDPREG